METDPLTLGALIFIGVLAGFIDSIVGGGGILTLPALSVALAPGVQAIATNKINGTVAAAVAALVYLKGRHPNWRRSLPYAGVVALGSVLGSLATPHVPVETFRWIM